MDSLKRIVYKVVESYAGKALNGYSYLTHNEDSSLLTVVDIAQAKGSHFSGVSIIVQIMDDMVIIERDQNDKLVVDALIQAGVPREQIILAYAGEPIPEIA